MIQGTPLPSMIKMDIAHRRILLHDFAVIPFHSWQHVGNNYGKVQKIRSILKGSMVIEVVHTASSPEMILFSWLK